MTSAIGESANVAPTARIASLAALALEKRSVPGRGDGDLLRICRRGTRGKPGDHLLMADRGDSRARLVQAERLDVAHELRKRLRLVRAVAGELADVSDSVRNARAGLCGGEFSVGPGEISGGGGAYLRDALLGREGVVD
jgi:hypothetical protein